MSRHIKTTSETLPRIVSTSRQAARVESATITDALGAERETTATPVLQGSPPALLALRQELCERLQSTGGRRGLEGATRRQKIPLSEADWQRLQQLAELSQTNGLRPTAGQVAGTLLHRALEALEQKIV